MKRGKKALSEIVTIVLILLLSIAAVILFYVIISNLLKDAGDKLTINTALVNLDIQSVRFSGQNLTVLVHREQGAGEIYALRFIFANATKTNITTLYDKAKIIGELETKAYTFDYLNSSIDFSTLSSVKVIPIFQTPKGREEPGITEEYKIVSSGSSNNCFNSIKDGSETDTDCGGECLPCGIDKSCLENADCSTNNCENGICKATSTCPDGSCGTEESCSTCAADCGFCNGDSCTQNSDCESNNCLHSICRQEGLTFFCGDSFCDSGETKTFCPQDCECDVAADCGIASACVSYSCEADHSCQTNFVPAGQKSSGCDGIGEKCDGAGACVSSLLLYLNMDNNVLDQSGNNNNGVWTNSPARYDSGKFGYAAALNKLDFNDYVLVSSSPTIKFEASKKYTLAFWVKSAPQSSQDSGDPKNAFISLFNSPNSGWTVSQAYSTIKLEGDPSGEPGTYLTGGSITPSSWNHVALVYNNGNVNFYLNGAGAGAGSITLQSSAGNLKIGAGNGPTNANMSIDEVLLFNDTLTQSEISSLIAAPFS